MTMCIHALQAVRVSRQVGGVAMVVCGAEKGSGGVRKRVGGTAVRDESGWQGDQAPARAMKMLASWRSGGGIARRVARGGGGGLPRGGGGGHRSRVIKYGYFRRGGYFFP